jgi:predicted nucleic acid-binding protein
MRVSRIPSGARVQLDTPTFVYHAEENSPYFPAADELFTRVHAGDLTAFTSALVLTELLVPYYRGNASELAGSMISALRDLPNLTFNPVDSHVAVRAAKLRARYNLHTPEAVHVATAVENGAQWFITDDHRLRRVESEGLRVWLFDESSSSNSGRK